MAMHGVYPERSRGIPRSYIWIMLRDSSTSLRSAQNDSAILIGDNFAKLLPNGGAPVTRNYIARLNPDGTLDTTFNPNVNDIVLAIALESIAKIDIYACGCVSFF